MTAAATLRGFLPACTSRRDRRPARDARVASWTDDRRVSAGGTPGPSEARRCQGTGSWGSGARRVSIAPIRCVSTPAKTSGSQSSQKTRPDPSLVEVRESTVSNELRAAAAARALSFYTYPADRSEFSVRAHRNMRIDAEWDAIRAKIAGTDVAFRHSRVSCVVATLDLDEKGVAPGGWADAGVDDSLDPSCYANVAPDGSNARRVVLGTLDVNQGVSLPAEELAGQFPRAEDPTPADVDVREDGRGTNGPKPGKCDRDGTDVDAAAAADGEGVACGIESAYEGSDAVAAAEGPNARPMRYRRAYLSNVCVLPVARRTGLGRRLMNRAMRVAKGWGVERLYVHVVADNVGARKFYEDLGFVVEAEESATFAAGLNRPRRLLLTQPVRDVPESEC